MRVRCRLNKVNPSNSTVDLSKIQSLKLFGEYNKAVVAPKAEEIMSAPETRLQLTLSGLVASDDVSIAAAIIENKKASDVWYR